MTEQTKHPTDLDQVRANEIANQLIKDRKRVEELEKQVTACEARIKLIELERDDANRRAMSAQASAERFRDMRDEALIQRAAIETNMLGLLEQGRDLVRHMESLCSKLQPIPLMLPENRAGTIQPDPRASTIQKQNDMLNTNGGKRLEDLEHGQ